ncbi:MAG: DUF3568 family protein [Alphaproteobacteria bacterium]
MKRGHIQRMAAIALVGLALQGCTSGGSTLFATGTGIAVGAGIDHTTGGIAYKTFTATTGDLRVATLGALRRMDLEVVRDGPKDDTHAIIAKAKERTIKIELETLSNRTSRMRVVANEGEIFFKDVATAAEIIVQTAASLDDIAQRQQQARSPTG